MTTGCNHSAGLRSFTLAWVLVALALSLNTARAAEVAVPAGSSSDFPREVVLRPEVLPYDLYSVEGPLDTPNAPFLKEPELGQEHVFSGALQVGKDPTNTIALIWDRPAGKLYFDLNRNLDLTDDPAGVFSSPHKGHFVQVFTNVILSLRTARGLDPTIVDLRLTSRREGRWILAQLSWRTLWQAKVALKGEPCLSGCHTLAVSRVGG